MDVLSIKGLQKKFSNHQVIDHLDLQVPKNCVFGFLGQNGAGKTTTMKMILGLLEIDGGTIHVLGEPVKYGQTKTNRHIGYLPDVPEFYNYMDAREYLSLCGAITGMSKQAIKSKSDELLMVVGLDKAGHRIGSYSRGMKQRLGIAQALMNSPKFLICDEPTSALDPLGRKEILDILYKVKDRTTVLFSSHILSDVERICDRVAVLHQGKIVLQGSIKDIKAHQKSQAFLLEFTCQEDLELFSDHDTIRPYMDLGKKDDRCLVFQTQALEALELDVIKVLAQLKILPKRLEVLDQSLESLFMEVTR